MRNSLFLVSDHISRPRAMYTLGCGHNFGKACLSKISNQKVHGKSGICTHWFILYVNTISAGLLTVPRCPTCNADFGILDLNILCPAELCVAIARNRISGHLAKQRTPSIKCKVCPLCLHAFHKKSVRMFSASGPYQGPKETNEAF